MNLYCTLIKHINADYFLFFKQTYYLIIYNAIFIFIINSLNEDLYVHFTILYTKCNKNVLNHQDVFDYYYLLSLIIIEDNTL